MTTLKAAAGALNHDAGLWEKVGHKLGDASGESRLLTLAAPAWPDLDDDGKLEAAYTSLQHRIATLLGEGSSQGEAIAAQLLHVRRLLESTDEAVRDSIIGLWDYET